MIKRSILRLSARRYLSGVLVYGLMILIYSKSTYYLGLLNLDAIRFLRTLYIVYVFCAFPALLLGHKDKTHKPLLLIEAFARLLTKKKISEEHRQASLAMLVKFFYIPLMTVFAVNNLNSLRYFWSKHWSGDQLIFNFRNDYPIIITLFLTIDTFFFAFGYLVEHSWLKNKIKSVEPTAIGWIVALATYPPFNSVTGNYLNWYSNDYFYWPDPLTDYTLKIIVVILMGVYLWATLSLGTKCSNLTNRGIVTNGAYKYIRHPAYAGKVTAWWIMALPHFSVAMIISMCGWTAIYFLRAITEEGHLSLDKDYLKYKKLTPYRFLPGIY